MMNQLHSDAEVDRSGDDNHNSHLAAHEVQTVIQSIRDASSTPVQLPAPEQQQLLSEQSSAGDDGAAYYWDASTMAPLNATSVAAIARLRNFKPPDFPLWDRLPMTRRAAVLLLLYADRQGDLRVVITMRAATLRSFSGHAALPGGKADSLDETPYQIARREAWEEIGLPQDDAKLPSPFQIEHLCYLPFNLAKTELVVRPCVALLHTGDSDPLAQSSASAAPSTPTVEESLMPRLDAREVAAVFSAPFHNFLRAADEAHLQSGRARPLPAGSWYEGSWTNWHERPWRMHYFYVPVNNQRVSKPRAAAAAAGAAADDIGAHHARDSADTRPVSEAATAAAAARGPAGADDDAVEEAGRYKVWGMTARILVDAATVAYGEQPEFEHNSHFGDEDIIAGLDKMGRLGEKKRAGSELTAEDLRRASDVSKI